MQILFGKYCAIQLTEWGQAGKARKKRDADEGVDISAAKVRTGWGL